MAALEARLNIALADYNEKARRDREKSAATPFATGGELGGGTLAAKVAEKIASARARDAQTPSNAGETGATVATEQSDQSEQSEQSEQSYPAARATATTDAASGDADDSPPEMFDTATEAAYLGEQAALEASDPHAAPAPDADEDEDDKTPGAPGKELPTMDALLARIPAETRETLENLFRARFVQVRKIPRKALE